MTPSTELRIKTMIRSLNESIIPALDTSNSIAQEQAGLLIGHLHALLDQNGREPELKLQNFEKIRQLALKLLIDADGGSITQQAAERLRRAIEKQCYKTLSLATEHLVMAEDATDTFKLKSRLSVLEFSKDQAEIGRDWFKVMGF